MSTASRASSEQELFSSSFLRAGATLLPLHQSPPAPPRSPSSLLPILLPPLLVQPLNVLLVFWAHVLHPPRAFSDELQRFSLDDLTFDLAQRALLYMLLLPSPHPSATSYSLSSLLPSPLLHPPLLFRDLYPPSFLPPLHPSRCCSPAVVSCRCGREHRARARRGA